jgi:hypothetical protein
MHDESETKAAAWHHVLAMCVVMACGIVLVMMEVCHHAWFGMKNAWFCLKKCGKNTKSE